MTSWPVLHEGLRRVLRELIIHGGQSRVDMARKLDVSRANLSRLARELLDLGLVSEGAAQHSQARGRPADDGFYWHGTCSGQTARAIDVAAKCATERAFSSHRALHALSRRTAS